MTWPRLHSCWVTGEGLQPGSLGTAPLLALSRCGQRLCAHPAHHHPHSLPSSLFSWAPRPCLPTGHAHEPTEVSRSPQSTGRPLPPAPTLLPSWGHDAVLPLLVIKKISQLPFHGCLATPKGGGGSKGEDSGANLETKSRIWVTWSLFLVLTWPGRGDEWGRGASSHPSVSHQ